MDRRADPQTQVLEGNLRDSNISTCLAVLNQLALHWGNRAELKKSELDPDTLYSAEKDDFLEDLLPFKNHPSFFKAEEQIKKKALSCGWIAYNEKTIDIESNIISPACLDIIYGRIPGCGDGTLRWIASQTLADEAYHVLLVVNTCRTTRRLRDLGSLKLPSFDLVSKMQLEAESTDKPWQRQLITLATATVSEVFISDYLSLIADCDSIQPANQLSTAAHRRDELAHSNIFKNIVKYVYPLLSDEQKRYFSTVLPKPVQWFASQEFDVWQEMLRQINFPGADSMIAECRAEAEIALHRIEYSHLITLAEEIGVLSSSAGQDSFSKAGIV